MNKLMTRKKLLGATAFAAVAGLLSVTFDGELETATHNNAQPSKTPVTDDIITASNPIQQTDPLPALNIENQPAITSAELLQVQPSTLTQKSVCYDSFRNKPPIENCEDVRTFSEANNIHELAPDLIFDVVAPLENDKIKACFISAMATNKLPALYTTDADGKSDGEGVSATINLDDLPAYQESSLDFFLSNYEAPIRVSFDQNYSTDIDLTSFTIHVSSRVGAGFEGYKFVTIFNHVAVNENEQLEAYHAKYVSDFSEDMPNYESVMQATPKMDRALRETTLGIVETFTDCNFASYDTAAVDHEIQVLKDRPYEPSPLF